MDGLISTQKVLDLWERYHPYIATEACEFDAELRKLLSTESQILTDTISRKAAIDALKCDAKVLGIEPYDKGYTPFDAIITVNDVSNAQPEIIRCCKCGFWDRDTLRHQFNDFRDWNEAECMILAERDSYHEIDRYTEADDFCSFAERREV